MLGGIILQRRLISKNVANIPKHSYISCGFQENHFEQFIFKTQSRKCRVIHVSRNSDLKLKNSNPCIFFGLELMAPVKRVHVSMFAFLTLQTLALGILRFSRGWCQNMTLANFVKISSCNFMQMILAWLLRNVKETKANLL